MSEREQNLFLLFAFLVVAGFCWLMKLGGDYQEEQILAVRPSIHYRVYKDGSVLAALRMPVNPGEYPDYFGPRLRSNYVNDTLEVFNVPLNSMWGVFDDYCRIKYQEFRSLEEFQSEVERIKNQFEVQIFRVQEF